MFLRFKSLIFLLGTVLAAGLFFKPVFALNDTEDYEVITKIYVRGSVRFEFPKIKGWIREIVVEKNMANDDCACFEYCDLITHRIAKRIGLNSIMYKDITKLKERYEQLLVKGMHPVNTDYRSIITHEIGHAITAYIAEKTCCAPVESIREEVLKETGFTLDDVADNLSHYAAYDNGSGEKDVADEFIAEAFAEYMDSVAPRTIAQKVGDKISSILSKD
jgi:hypothetical protein